MSRIDALFEDYGSYHRTRGNLVCHALGITLIVYGTVALFQLVHVGSRLTGAEVMIAAAFLFYLTLSLPLAMLMLVETVACDVVAGAVGNWQVGLAAFVVGWVFQSIGHAVYEKKSPAFFKNLMHLMIGPVFLWNELLRRLKSSDLRA